MELMIWTIVSSKSCFCWLFRTSPSSAAKNIINLILVIDHLVMSTCRVISCVVGRECLLWPVNPLGKTLLAFALLHFVFEGQMCLLLQVPLDFQLLHSNRLQKIEEYYLQRKWNLAVCNNISGLWKHYAEISQTEKDKYHMISLTYGIWMTVEEIDGCQSLQVRDRQNEWRGLNDTNTQL